MTPTPDIINAVFEAGGALLLVLNVQRLYRDKKLSGISIWPTVWWQMWGAWNIYFYRAIGTTWSFYAGLAVFAMNTVWLGLATYYAVKQRTT
jgi:hypothetical protein